MPLRRNGNKYTDRKPLAKIPETAGKTAGKTVGGYSLAKLQKRKRKRAIRAAEKRSIEKLRLAKIPDRDVRQVIRGISKPPFDIPARPQKPNRGYPLLTTAEKQEIKKDIKKLTESVKIIREASRKLTKEQRHWIVNDLSKERNIPYEDAKKIPITYRILADRIPGVGRALEEISKKHGISEWKVKQLIKEELSRSPGFARPTLTSTKQPIFLSKKIPTREEFESVGHRAVRYKGKIIYLSPAQIKQIAKDFGFGKIDYLDPTHLKPSEGVRVSAIPGETFLTEEERELLLSKKMQSAIDAHNESRYKGEHWSKEGYMRLSPEAKAVIDRKVAAEAEILEAEERKSWENQKKWSGVGKYPTRDPAEALRDPKTGKLRPSVDSPQAEEWAKRLEEKAGREIYGSTKDPKTGKYRPPLIDWEGDWGPRDTFNVEQRRWERSIESRLGTKALGKEIKRGSQGKPEVELRQNYVYKKTEPWWIRKPPIVGGGGPIIGGLGTILSAIAMYKQFTQELINEQERLLQESMN